MPILPDIALVTMRLIFEIMSLGNDSALANISDYSVLLIFLIDLSLVEALCVTPLPVPRLLWVEDDWGPLGSLFLEFGHVQSGNLLVRLPGLGRRIMVGRLRAQHRVYFLDKDLLWCQFWLYCRWRVTTSFQQQGLLLLLFFASRIDVSI